MQIQNDIWKKKNLIWEFAIGDLKVRYRNSVLGFFWTILEPLLILSVLYFVFTNIFQSDIEYFALYLLLGLLLWNVVVRGTQIGMSSLTSRSHILTLIQIPILIPPISASITSLIMLAFELVVLVMFMVAFQFIPPVTILILPLVIVLEFILVLGLSLPLSVLNVKFKDIQFIWGVILTAGFFLSPIFYSIDKLPKEIQSIIIFNPMVPILNIARDVTLYGKIPSIDEVAILIFVVLSIFGMGYMGFRILGKKILEEL